MQWFHVYLSNMDMQVQNEQKLTAMFSNLLKKLGEPDGLAMFSLIFRSEQANAYYFSVPEKYAPQLKDILAHFDSEIVKSPNLKVLKLILGRNTHFSEYHERIEAGHRK